MNTEQLKSAYRDGAISTSELLRTLQALPESETTSANPGPQDGASLAQVRPQRAAVFTECQRVNPVTAGRPVFWVHGAFGDASVFIPLAELIQRPFYGIQARGLFDDAPVLSGVRSIAEFYRHLIQSVQPCGPYDLGGYSIGGTLVYEVVQQLQAAGETIRSLTLVDSLFPPCHKRLEGDAYKSLRFVSRGLIHMTFHKEPARAAQVIDSLTEPYNDRATVNELLESFVAMCVDAGVEKPPTWIREYIRKMLEIQQGYRASEYVPVPLPHEIRRICYFKNRAGLFFGKRASHLNTGTADPLLGIDYWSDWKTLLPNLSYQELPVDNHLTIFSEPTGLQAIRDYCIRIYSLSADDKTSHSSQPRTSSDTAHQQTPQTVASTDAEQSVIKYLKNLLCSTIGKPAQQLYADQPFENYGIDSLMATQLTNQLQSVFGPLSVTLLFEYRTLRELAAYFLEFHPEELYHELGLAGDADSVGHLHSTVTTLHSSLRSDKLAARDLRQSPSKQVMEIAVIGLSGSYPEARDLQQYWQNLRDAKDCITEVPADRWDWHEYFSDDPNQSGVHFSKYGGFLEDMDKFDPLFFNIPPRDAELMDPQERLFLEHAWKAIEDAGYCVDDWQSADSPHFPAQVGVYVGVMAGEYQFYGVEASARGNRIAFAGNLGSIANRVSYTLNLHGPSLAVDTACSSSLTSLHLACQDLLHHKTHLAIAGGVNISIHPNKYLGLSAGQFISTRGHCASFGASGDGYIPGEGVGAVVLKRLADAERDHDHIYGVIRASAVNHGGRTHGYTVPNPQAQQMAIAQALAESGLDPRWISYVEAHGTGTPLGDPIEIAALTKAFHTHGADAPSCWIGSAKSNIGHCEAAAGIAGVTKVLLQMQHEQLAPSLHSVAVNPHVDFESTPFTVNQKLRPWTRSTVDGISVPRVAGISSFGAGGSNAHVIISEHSSRAHHDENSGGEAGSALIVLSARNEDRVRDVAANLHRFLTASSSLDIHDIAYTLQVGRQAMEERLALLADSVQDLASKLAAFLEGGLDDCDVFQNRVEQDKLERFAADEDMAERVEIWFRTRQFRKLLNVWTQGFTVDWKRLYGTSLPRRISLPTYPFVRERYWLPDDLDRRAEANGMNRQDVTASDPPSPSRNDDGEVMFFEEVWTEQVLPDTVPQNGFGRKTVVCYLSDTTAQRLCNEAISSLSPQSTVVFVAQGDGYVQHTRQNYAVCCHDAESHQAAWQRIAGEFGTVDAVFYMWPLEDPGCLRDTAGIVATLQALARTGTDTKHVLLAGQFENGLDRCYLESWVGFERSLPLILPETSVLAIGRSAVDQELSIAEWIQTLWAELHTPQPQSVLYEGQERLVCQVRPSGIRFDPGLNPESLDPATDDVEPQGRQGPSIRHGTTWLIIGGCGRLGLLFAEHLARCASVNLVLTGRSTPTSEQQTRLAAIEASGSRILYLQADICDVPSMLQGLDKTTARFSAIHGVIHAAGLEAKQSLFDKSLREFQQVLDPKIKGTLVLDEILADQPLDFVCYFSSSAAILGDFGSCDYAIGNRFQMAYARYRDQMRADGTRAGHTIAINWPLWKQGGMGVSDSAQAGFYLKSSGQRFLTTDEGLAAFQQLLPSNSTQQLVLAGRPERVHRFLGLPHLRSDHSDGVRAAAGSDLEQQLTADLNDHTRRFLKLADGVLDTRKDFADHGFDSVSLAEFARVLSRHYGINVVPSVFFAHSTVGKLAQHLLEEHAPVIAEFYGDGDVVDRTGASVESDPDPVTVSPQTIRLPPPAPVDPGVDEPIAIIGMSGRFPHADTVTEFWENLANGTSCLSEIPHERRAWWEQSDDSRETTEAISGVRGGFITNVDHFDPLFFNMSSRDAATMDPRQRLFLEESWHAFEDAGYMGERIRGKSCGVYVGVEEGDYGMLCRQGAINSNQNATLAAWIAYTLDLRGPNLALTAACSSGLVALHQACLALRQGDCAMALVGGVNLLLSPLSLIHLDQAGMLSPDGHCRVFSRNANGLVPGEAVTAVLLKPLSRAIDDNDRIYGYIKASGVNYDGRTNGITAPNPLSQTQLLTAIYRRHNISPSDIQLVLGHSVGSRLGDEIEFEALQAAFREFTQESHYCALSSIKPFIGHTFAASGVASLIAMLLSMQNRTLLGLPHIDQPNENIDLTATPFVFHRQNRSWEARDQRPRMGAISTTGISGTNAHVVIEEYQPSASAHRPSRNPVSSPEQPGAVHSEDAESADRRRGPTRVHDEHASRTHRAAAQIAVFSAATAERLRVVAQNAVDFLASHTDIPFADLVYTLQVGREAMDTRLAVLADSVRDLRRSLSAFLSGSREGQAKTVFTGQFAGQTDSQQAAVQAAIQTGDTRQLASLWTAGAAVDWNALHHPFTVRIVSFPTYPFVRRRCGIDSAGPLEPLAHRQADVSDASDQEHSEPAVEFYTIGANEGRTTEEYLTFAPFMTEVPGFSATRVWLNRDAYPDEVDLIKRAQIEMRQVLFFGEDFRRIHRVLDFGCGHAADIIHLAEKYLHIQADGLTITKAQVDLGNQRIVDRQLDSRVTVLHRDSTKGSLPHRYDLIIGFEVSFHIQDKQALFGNLASALNRGGRILLMDYIVNLRGPLVDSNLQISIPTQAEWANLLSAERLVIEELIDVSPQIANFLHDPDFEQNIRGLPQVTEDMFRNFMNQSKALRNNWITYSLFKIDRHPEYSEHECRELNLAKIANQTPYPDARKALGVTNSTVHPCAHDDATDETTALSASAPRTQCATVRPRVVTILSRVLGFQPEEVDQIGSLPQLGVTSLNAVELVEEINRTFGLRLPTSLVFECNSLDALIQTVSGRLPETDTKLALRPPTRQPPDRIVAASSQANPRGETQGRPHDVAIIGIACRCAGATDPDEFWRLVSQGRNCVQGIEDPDWLDYFQRNSAEPVPTRYGQAADRHCFDAEFFRISPREARAMDVTQRLLLEETYHALEDAGYAPSAFGEVPVGVYLGLTGANSPYLDDLSHHALLGSDTSIAAARIAHFLDLKGPALAVNTACSSSLVAMDLACQALRNGDVDVTIAGGCTIWTDPGSFVTMNNAGMLSPGGQCRPFDRDADGIVVGDGVGIVVLKRLREAERDGDSIYAVIRASGINQDGRTSGITVPSVASQSRLQTSIYKRHRIPVDGIQYVEAHGTATRLGDPIEIDALTNTFRQLSADGHACAIGSLKANIGHTAAAAGVLSVIKVALSLRYRQIPPTINFERQNHQIDFEQTPFYANTELCPWPENSGRPRLAALNCFGFSGTNAHMVLEEYVGQPARTPAPDRDAHFLVLSARSDAALRRIARNLSTYVAAQVENVGTAAAERVFLRSLVWTLQTGRDAMSERLGFLVHSLDELQQAVAQYLESETPQTDAAVHICRGSVGSHRELAELVTSDPDIVRTMTSWASNGDIRLLEAWTRGCEFDWRILHDDKIPQRLHFPVYPFERDKWNLPRPDTINPDRSTADDSPVRVDSDPEWLFFTDDWTPGPIDADFDWQTAIDRFADKSVLVLATDDQDAEVLRSLLKQLQRGRCPSQGFELRFQHIHELPDRSTDRPPDVVLFCGPSITPHASLEPDDEDLRNVLRVSQHFLRSAWDETIRFYYAFEQSDESPRLDCEALSGFLRSAMLENPRHAWTLIGYSGKHGNQSRTQTLLTEALFDTAQADQARPFHDVRYVDGQRLVRRLTEVEYDHTNNPPVFRRDATYLIAGGLGPVGEYLCCALAKHCQPRLVILSRSPFNESKRDQCRTIEALGSQVDYYAVDISDRTALEATFARVKETVGPIHGVFHLARLVEDAPVHSKTWSSFRRVIDAKVNGAIHLDELTADEPLDFFLLASSIAAFGIRGSADYGYSAAFQNAFARYRQRLCDNQSRSGMSISQCWGAWNVDKYKPQHRTQRIQAAGLVAMDIEQVFPWIEAGCSGPHAVLGLLLASQPAQVRGHLGLQSPEIIETAPTGLEDQLRQWERAQRAGRSISFSDVNRIISERDLAQLDAVSIDRLYDLLFPGGNGAVSGLDRNKPKPPPVSLVPEDPAESARAIREVLCEVLELKQVDETRSFQDYGLDSISAMQMSTRLEKRLNREVPPQWMIEFPNVQELTQQLDSSRNGHQERP